MVNNDHINHYSASDILRYLHGKMLPAEMHAMERAALDDPFLADAIEGMQHSLEQYEAPVQDDIHELGKRLKQRIATSSDKGIAPVLSFRWWQVAAAAAVVIVGGLWAWSSMLNSDDSPSSFTIVAQQENKKDLSVLADSATTAPGKPAAKDTTVVIKNEYSFSTTANSAASEPADNSGSLDALREIAKAKSGAKKEVVTHAPAPVAFAESKQADIEDRKEFKSELAVADKKMAPVTFGDSLREATSSYKESMAGKGNLQRQQKVQNLDIASNRNRTAYEQVVLPRLQKDSANTNYFSRQQEIAMNTSRRDVTPKLLKKNPNALLSGIVSGRVTDQYNNPISNALVRVDDNIDFFTDSKGQFTIPAQDSVVNAVVGYAGYYSRNVQLQNNKQYNYISLNQVGYKAPNPALNYNNVGTDKDTGMVGMGWAKAKSASNVSGNLALDSYSYTNGFQDTEPECGWLQYQQYLDKNKQLTNHTDSTSQVVVSFAVHKKGILSDFRIEESFGNEAFNKEAIRLIKAGPRWKLNKVSKARANVVVRF